MKVYIIEGYTPYEGSSGVLAVFATREAAEKALPEVSAGGWWKTYDIEEHEVSEEQSKRFSCRPIN